MSAVLRAAEAVFPGHPDKLCDSIADALVEEAVRRQKRARCRIAVALHHDRIAVAGRIAAREAQTIDVAALIRSVSANAGYADGWRPGPEQLHVENHLRLAPPPADDEPPAAADQSITVGYAVDLPGACHLPAEQWLAWRLAKRLHLLRKSDPSLATGPAGRVLVVLEARDDSFRAHAVSVSLQQAESGSETELHLAVRAAVQEEIQEAVWRLPAFSPEMPEEIHVVPFSADTGASGAQLVADAYGPGVPSSGAALSGKDFYDPDRAGALIARRLAKAVVLTGAARACTATLAFVPGQQAGRLLTLIDQDGRALDSRRWSALVDLSLAGVGDRYSGRANLAEVAAWGHFTSPERPWERISLDGEGGMGRL
jgi:S-adenosylmethionine synthetase